MSTLVGCFSRLVWRTRDIHRTNNVLQPTIDKDGDGVR